MISVQCSPGLSCTHPLIGLNPLTRVVLKSFLTDPMNLQEGWYLKGVELGGSDYPNIFKSSHSDSESTKQHLVFADQGNIASIVLSPTPLAYYGSLRVQVLPLVVTFVSMTTDSCWPWPLTKNNIAKCNSV